MILKHVGIVFCWSKVHVDQQCTEWKAKGYTRWPILLFAVDMLVLGSVYLGNIVLKLKKSAAPSKGYEKTTNWRNMDTLPINPCEMVHQLSHQQCG